MTDWDWAAFRKYLFNPYLLDGAWTTVWLSVAVMAIGLLLGLAAIIRAGILSVPRGQFDAARAVGMPYWTMLRVIILPQAARVIIPPLGNNFNGLLKTTSLASVISLEELLRRSQMLIQLEF